MHNVCSPTLLLLFAALTLQPVQANAADGDSFTLRLGVIRLDGDTRVNGSTRVQGDDFGYRSDQFKFGDRTVARLDGEIRFTERQRMLFNYFSYLRSEDYVAEHDFMLEGITIPAGSDANAQVRIKLGTLVYDYTVAENRHAALSLQLGTAWGQIAGRVRASVGPLSAAIDDSRNGFAPVIGARLHTRSGTGRWRFDLQGQYVNASWASLDSYRGDVLRLNAMLEYRVTPHFGLNAGYDWFRLNVDHDFGRLDGGMTLRFMGPTAGFTLAF